MFRFFSADVIDAELQVQGAMMRMGKKSAKKSK